MMHNSDLPCERSCHTCWIFHAIQFDHHLPSSSWKLCHWDPSSGNITIIDIPIVRSRDHVELLTIRKVDFLDEVGTITQFHQKLHEVHLPVTCSRGNCWIKHNSSGIPTNSTISQFRLKTPLKTELTSQIEIQSYRPNDKHN